MLLQAVKATNSRGSVLSLPLEDISAGFVVKNIAGLTPVKATLVSSSFANVDGEQYHSSRRDARNIVFTLGLKPDYAVTDVETLRDQLYGYFMPKSTTLLTFTAFDKFTQNFAEQSKDFDIAGRIESCDGDIFTEDPELQVSVMCYDPDFYDPTEIVVDGATVFDLTESIVTYDGTVDTGVIFTLSPNRDLSAFTIFHQPPDGSLRTIDFSFPLLAGDTLAISSVPGSKYAQRTSGGVQSSVLYGISPQSGWLTLEPGDNKIRVYAEGTPIPYTIEYTNKYGGL